MWTGGYYGVMVIETNTAAVKNLPQNWSDLLKPEYKGQVALSGPSDRIKSGAAVYFRSGSWLMAALWMTPNRVLISSRK